MKWLPLVLAVACSRGGTSEAPPPPPTHAPPVVVAPTPILAQSTQLVTAVLDDWASTTATLALWHRTDATTWQRVGEPWTGVVGANGAAWGIGLHGEGPPLGHTGPNKLEGDKKSPAGSFAIGAAWGYATAPPSGTKLPYTPSDDQIKCVDDPSSLHYATIVNQAGLQIDWHSAEDMRRRDPLYTWVVDIAHNPSRVPGEGSCIFLHVWKDAASPTVGCTAMPEPQLKALLTQLDPAQHPTFVLLPRKEYASLIAAWGLPPL